MNRIETEKISENEENSFEVGVPYDETMIGMPGLL